MRIHYSPSFRLNIHLLYIYHTFHYLSYSNALESISTQLMIVSQYYFYYSSSFLNLILSNFFQLIYLIFTGRMSKYRLSCKWIRYELFEQGRRGIYTGSSMRRSIHAIIGMRRMFGGCLTEISQMYGNGIQIHPDRINFLNYVL